ncbi:hypothetical protein [Streptomyces sp. enrichment culture]|uniref:hypothetical protein n=1 Tax=Streptomyces sp. enrichment culture TaxID=1795815 RepID=UPI003F55251B
MTFSRARVAATAVGLVGALALTACSGDGDSGGSGGSGPAPTPTPSATAPDGYGSTGAPEDPASELEGSWLTTAGGTAVALMVTGEQAALFATGGTVCSGTAREDAGTHTIRLKCTDGSADRTNGTVDSVGASSLKVTWEGALGTETYTKAEGGKLPSGLPTEGLGS